MESHFVTTHVNTDSFYHPPRQNTSLLCVRRLLLLHSRFGGRSQECLGHHGRMVVRYLPLPILPNIHEGVPSLYFIASGSHSELVNSCILAPIVADSDVRPVKRSLKKQKMRQYHINKYNMNAFQSITYSKISP